jgi:hypothetical protein
MKKRYIYSLLFGIPGLFVAGIVSILVFAAFAGILWLYVFGDDPWPGEAESILAVLFVLFFVVLWTGLIILGYLIGRRLERDPTLNRNHVLISAALTVIFLLLMLFQQWTVGNLGPISDSSLCSDFCARHGYAGSGMPPEDSGERTCSCYDDSGAEVFRVPLDHIAPHR